MKHLFKQLKLSRIYQVFTRSWKFDKEITSEFEQMLSTSFLRISYFNSRSYWV